MEDIKKIVGTIQNGSCFLVSKEYILTAGHCVSGVPINNKLEVNFKYLGEKKEAILLEKITTPLDIAILRLIEPFENDPEIRLVNDIVFREDRFSIYGYPRESREIGKIISGTINDCDLKLIKKEDKCDEVDLKLFSNDITRVPRGFIEGISGSPVIVSKEIIGIVKNYLGDTIGAQQMVNCIDILKKYNIDYKNESLFKETLFHRSLKDVEMNKKSKKYIPEVYIESNNIKDKIRYFSEPDLFLERLLDSFKNIDCTYLNSNLLKANLKTLNFKEVDKLEKYNEKTLKEKCFYLNEYIKETKKYIKKISLKEEIETNFENIDKKNYDYLKYKLRSNLEWKLDNYLEILELLNSKVLLILDNAGRGKTTLLCDIVENMFLKKQQICIFISAYKILNGDIIQTLRDEFFQDFCSNENEFFVKLDYIGRKTGKNIIFIIDGLNESDNLREFSIKLNRFIEKIQSYEYLKVIMSCRKEYFEERFKELVILKNEKQICCIDKTFNIDNDDLSGECLKKYFKFFNIKILSIDIETKEKLLENPLLLRFFCEAYSDKQLNEIKNLYKYDLFQKYTEKKYEKIKEYNKTEEDLNRIFDTISKYMLDNNEFTQVPLNIITDEEFIKQIIYEDIIFKDGLVEKITRTRKVIEVVSFTFDEYRDYNLAWYMLENYSDENILEKVNELKETSVIEGVSRYIYNIAKNNENKLLKKIEKEKWTIEPFLEYIFGVEDSDVKETDLEKLESIFNLTPRYNYKIFISLIKRREKRYKNLNIAKAFEFITKMNAKSYIINFLSNFNVQKDYSRFYIEKDKEIDYYLKYVEEIMIRNIENGFMMALIVLPVVYEYDIYFKTKNLVERIYNTLGEKGEELIDEFLKNSNNELLNEFLIELKVKNKISFVQSYHYKITSILEEEKK